MIIRRPMRRHGVGPGPGASAVALLLGGLLLATGGCKRTPVPPEPPPPPTPVLGPVTITDLTPEQARPAGTQLDLEALQAEARKVLDGGKIFAPGKADGGAAVVARVRME